MGFKVAIGWAVQDIGFQPDATATSVPPLHVIINQAVQRASTI